MGCSSNLSRAFPVQPTRVLSQRLLRLPLLSRSNLLPLPPQSTCSIAAPSRRSLPPPALAPSTSFLLLLPLFVLPPSLLTSLPLHPPPSPSLPPRFHSLHLSPFQLVLRPLLSPSSSLYLRLWCDELLVGEGVVRAAARLPVTQLNPATATATAARSTRHLAVKSECGPPCPGRRRPEWKEGLIGVYGREGRKTEEGEGGGGRGPKRVT